MLRYLSAFFLSLSMISPAEAGVSPVEPRKVTVYPNPASQFISIDNADQVSQIVIINLVGRKLKNFESVRKEEQYDISELPAGMYLVQLLDARQKVLSTVRISKR
ncbi:MAG: hypothetical protein RLY31_1379 [Bacteroidota bacterium]|jgi:hypothetical protein